MSNLIQDKEVSSSFDKKAFIHKITLYGLAFSLLFSSVVFIFATPYMTVATLAYCLMCLGVINRGSPQIHSKFMASAIFIDVSLVLVLEVFRSAIKTALAFSLTFPQQMHILMSLMAILFYIPIVYLGIQGLKNGLSLNKKKLHMKFGITAFIFRTLGFILMFSLLKKA